MSEKLSIRDLIYLSTKFDTSVKLFFELLLFENILKVYCFCTLFKTHFFKISSDDVMHANILYINTILKKIYNF